MRNVIAAIGLAATLVCSNALAAIAYVASGTPVEDVTTISVAVPLPAGVSSGHAMFIVANLNADDQSEVIDAPTGFVLTESSRRTTTGTDSIEVALFCKIHDGSETDPTITATGEGTGDVLTAFSFAFSGAHTACADIVAHTNETSASSGSAGIPTAALTNSTANVVILSVGAKRIAWGSVDTLDTDGLAWAEIAEYDTGTGDDSGIVADYFIDDATPTSISADAFVIQTPSASDFSASLIVAIKPEAIAEGEFSVNPTVTAQDTNDYTLSGTTDASTEVDAVACKKDSAAPDVAEVDAGNCDGVAAEAHTSDTWNGADSLTLGGALTLKIYDLYATDGTTLVALVDEQLDVAAGYERTILGAQDPTSVYAGTETVSGDYADTEAVTSPGGYVVTPEADGTISYAAGGDPSRQFVLGNVHDLSESDIDSYQFVFNNLICDPEGGLFDEPLLWQKDVAITPLDLASLCIDPEGDDVTATNLEALPPGASITDSVLSATPTVCGSTVADHQWADPYGEAYIEAVTFNVGDLVPDVENNDEATAIAAIEAVCNFTATAGEAEYSDTVAVGNVIRTDPVNGWLSPSGQEVTYFLSLGEQPYPDTWVSYARVWMFKEVRRVYLTTTAFKDAVEAELRGAQVWARWAPGLLPWSGSSNMQINVVDIPNVPPLYDNGAVRPQ